MLVNRLLFLTDEPVELILGLRRLVVVVGMLAVVWDVLEMLVDTSDMILVLLETAVLPSCDL